jgi:quercetin dioxygenase-like cupin family protein
MEIIKGRDGMTVPSEQRTATFTGLVYADPVLARPDGTIVASVFFAPAARTFWHWHERGQLLQVISGHGLICAEGGPPQPLGRGDIVWVPAGERHWHGAGPLTSLSHLAVSLGTTSWLGPVSDAEYGGAR